MTQDNIRKNEGGVDVKIRVRVGLSDQSSSVRFTAIATLVPHSLTLTPILGITSLLP